ncbi:SufB/SufD family protein [Sedimentimonas flavescens]|uniref:SufB/SufD family protein n=1 Tax=Sedimentimonas flavescens TaxID=2851012 RepID=UPI0021A80473|nr:SufD family Fe-S cluster assembly protein [Sedimentimonas flavescens]MCT2538346.1 SufD family Fe-S cluster assembly protein [Sedimentimonas flavescens]WBL31680.1 SufD family Fe-S cluster assembly protein [Sinirhodobacter sp. HNIBRBA609]
MTAVEKQTPLEARLAAIELPKGGAFAAMRADALARLVAMGLPGRRDEYWRYTDPAALNAPLAPAAKPFEASDETPLFDGMDRVKLVFVDGVFDAEASDSLELAGVEIARLAEAETADIHWAQGLYGTLESAGQSPVVRPFAALNSAAASDGLLIRVTGKAAKPVSLIYVHRSETSDPILHHVIKLEPGAEFTLLENGPAGARFNKVMEVDVGAGARFHHIRAQGRDHERRAVTGIFARVAEGALFKSFTMTVNGVLTRNECVIDMVGDDAVAHVAGAALGDGASGAFHHDDTVFVTHGAERGESRQVFKKVLKHGAVGTFQGKILVKPGAQKTDGYQISQSLLLDDDSQFLGKPELEIYADDVKCSHGSTTGALDETAMFYLRSRGVPHEEATALLVLSFLADAIDEIEDEALKDEIVARLEGWLARHRG